MCIDPCSAQCPGVRWLTCGWDAGGRKQPLSVSIEVVGMPKPKVGHESSSDSSESLVGSVRQWNGRVERWP
jgi:hypothetical protein